MLHGYPWPLLSPIRQNPNIQVPHRERTFDVCFEHNPFQKQQKRLFCQGPKVARLECSITLSLSNHG